jgi:RNA polymerase sigma-70 factor (ECF subfamily)
MKSIDKVQLIIEYGEKISRLSNRMLWNSELAKDASQEVWLEILKSLSTFNGESNISTWIYTIARRTLIRFAKSEKLISSKEINDQFNRDPIDYTGIEEKKTQWVKEKCDYCLTAFCHCLNNESRLIFLFRTIAELPYAQISEIIGKDEDTIRQIASRSIRKVRHFMKKDCVLFNPDGNCRCRIQKHIREVELDKEYRKLEKAALLVDFFKKFDKELPQVNYWKNILLKDVTN